MNIIEVTGVIFATVVGIVSLVLSIHNERKLASKEHELAENLKTDILLLIGIIRSIQYRRRLTPNLTYNVTIDDEINALKKIRLTIGYVYLINQIQDNGDKLLFEIYTLLLVDNKLSLNDVDTIAMQMCHILYKLKDNKELGGEIQKVIINMIEDELLKEVNPKIPSEFEGFVKYLVERGITDPDVRLFHGVFGNDVNTVKKALDDGADTKCTDKIIVERYEKEYKEFLISDSK